MDKKQSIECAFENFALGLNQSFQLKGIFFDMDGVLFDSMPLHAIAWKEAFRSYDLDLPEFEAYMNEGSTAYFTVKRMFKKYRNQESSPELTEAIKKRKHDYMATLPPANVMPHMQELLNQMHEQQLSCWVVTGSAQRILIDRIEKEYNGVLSGKRSVTAHDVKIGKPHPEPYLKGMEKSGLKTNEAVVVENAPLGVEAAKAAGLFTIAINTGPLDPDVLNKAGADLVLSGSKELLQLWPAIFEMLSGKRISEKYSV